VIVTTGAVISKTATAGVAALLSLPTRSCATFAATLSVTSPLAVIPTVYVRASTALKLATLMVPLTTAISPLSKPVTSSSNTMLMENSFPFTNAGTF